MFHPETVWNLERRKKTMWQFDDAIVVPIISVSESKEQTVIVFDSWK